MSPAELQGVALAAYVVSVSVLRRLKENGILQQKDVQTLLIGVLQSLEQNELFSAASATAARQLLAPSAEEMGVLLQRPH